jgi:type VI secretion system protein ImpA
MISITKLVDAIAPDKPSGDDLAYDPAFLELQNKLRGKEETQFSAAEDPNWKELLDLALELARRFKHLQVGVTLTLALLQTEGLLGFRDGLKLVQGWLEKYWDTVYPLLDPEDNLDPTERANLLQCLSVTTQGDPYRFCDRLGKIPLCESKTLGRFDLAIIKHGRAPAGTGGTAAATDPAQVAAAFRDTASEYLQSRYEAVTESLAILKHIDGLLGTRIGAGRTPDFELLKRTLEEIRALMLPYVTPAPGAAAESDMATGPAAAKPLKPGAAGIQTREDVLAVLRAVCEYYQQQEPSSPVPFLLQRAQRLATMDFLQIMSDMAPDAMAQVKNITGAPEKTN